MLLTRYPTEFGTDDARPDLHLRWFEVADWLEGEVAAADAASEIAGFLLRQFLNFLEVRSMSLTHVGKYMPDGLRAVSSLLNMLMESAVACKVPVKRSAGWDYLGVSLAGGKFWVGVTFAHPETLWFATYCRIDHDRAIRLARGEVVEEGEAWGGYSWQYGVELDSEEAHFYSRSKVSQMQWLEEFLRDCIVTAGSIEGADQPPLAADAAENI